MGKKVTVYVGRTWSDPDLMRFRWARAHRRALERINALPGRAVSEDQLQVFAQIKDGEVLLKGEV